MILDKKEFEIRLLKKSDKKELFDFFSNLSYSSKKYYSPHSFDKRTINLICEKLKKTQNYKRVIILNEKKIVGYCVLLFGARKSEKIRYNNTLFEEEVCTIAPCITDNFQRMGLGQELLNYVIEICKKFGKKKLILWGGVVVNNEPAIRFYKKMNFIVDKKWKHTRDRVDCCDMYLDIGKEKNKIKTAIMIIGAAGSLGSELCKLLSNNNYYIVAVDINENDLMYLYRTFNIPIYVENIQDFERLCHIIEYENIQIVINCAASKHVKWCEFNMKRAVNINILANLEIMNYLHKKGKEFIFISSDKAIKPTNIYALTKQLTDYIVNFYNFKLVRGVNFLNSKGSVLDIWNKQKQKKDKTFSLVKENCKRYFIPVSDMADLVKKSIEENNYKKTEYIPTKIYEIFIQDLFKAFLKLNNITDYKVNEFLLPKGEKLIEDINFVSEIIELRDLDKVIELIKEEL